MPSLVFTYTHTGGVPLAPALDALEDCSPLGNQVFSDQRDAFFTGQLSKQTLGMNRRNAREEFRIVRGGIEESRKQNLQVLDFRTWQGMIQSTKAVLYTS